MRSPSESVKLLFDPKSGCWLSTADPAGVIRFQTDPRQYPFHALLPVLAFTASCFRISFSTKVQLIPPSHTSPLLRCPPDGPNIFTHLPETIRSISVPVVFGGSCSSSVAVESAALLCCVKTSVPTRLCIALIFFPLKGGERVRQHSVILCR